jgi:hypothetical protein
MPLGYGFALLASWPAIVVLHIGRWQSFIAYALASLIAAVSFGALLNIAVGFWIEFALEDYFLAT